MCRPPSRHPALRRLADLVQGTRPALDPEPLRHGDLVGVLVRDPDDPARVYLVRMRVVPRRR